MKKSKQTKESEHEDGVDKIGKLPDDVLELILSRLQGTEETIRTSILSRRWRYLWTSVPSIDIDYARRFNPSQEFNKYKFKKFVNRVLLNKKPMDLDSFRLSCLDHYRMATIRRWIDAAVMIKVKVIDLMFCHADDDIELPQCLVTCGSLEVLKLNLIGYPLSLPKFTGFSALRVLELREVDFLYNNYKVVKYFIESCPLLEDLSLLHCRVHSLVLSSPKLKNLRIDSPFYSCQSLEICCPKLEFFMLRGYVDTEFLFESLYSLKKAVIHPRFFYDVKAHATLLDLFAKISHVEYLSISIYCISEFFDVKRDAPIISLPNLKTLEITVDSLHGIIPFLKCLPDLESLHLIITKYAYGLDKLNLEEAETINILTRHLKKVQFLEFDGTKLRLDVARVLLEHGNVLEEMVFSWGKEAKFHKRSMKTMKKVSKFLKASSTVKLTAVFNPTQPN